MDAAARRFPSATEAATRDELLIHSLPSKINSMQTIENQREKDETTVAPDDAEVAAGTHTAVV